MKRYITAVFLGLGLSQAAWAQTSVYRNYGVVTNAPVVDALNFLNEGLFDIETVAAFNSTNQASAIEEGSASHLPFTTTHTINFTNTGSGVMEGIPGFQFDTATASSRHSALNLLNEGTIEGVDFEAVMDLYSPPGSTGIAIVPAVSQPFASQILVDANNIVNSGAMSVGNYGLLSLVGKNVTTAYGTLAAGTVDSDSQATTNFVSDLTGLQGQIDIFLQNNGPYYYLNSPGVYDLFWGVTNALTVDTSAFPDELPYGIPDIFTGQRGDDVGLGVPFNLTADFSTNAFILFDGTNIYYNVVFVNTNFSNSNMSATIGIGGLGDEFLQYESTTVPIVANGYEVIVQIAEPVFDVITGQTVTNAIYLIDDGALLPSMSLSLNAGAAGPYHRPNAFALTTTAPFGWEDATLFAEEDAFPYEQDLIYTEGIFNGTKEPLEISDYGAQIGRNPANASGYFTTLAETNSDAFEILSELSVSLPDPTNDPARIQVNADNFNVTQARIRANGMVILNVTNLVGGGTSAVDWGEANATIGVKNGFLNISNIFPTTFQRIRGDIYAKSASWQNTQTNQFGSTNAVTNQWHYHVLVVDQNLFGSFPSTVRNLTLTGKGGIVLQDNLNVIGHTVLDTTKLTIESSNYFSQNADTFTPANTPSMKDLFINTNGFLGAANLLDIGFNRSQGQSSPSGRKYSVNSITNFGRISSTAPLLESANFENDGVITANNSGSILIEANNLDMGLALTNITNSLLAGGSVTLSAANIVARNSVITTGRTSPSPLLLDATTELTDFVSSTPTTNTNSVIINHWTVNDGFSMATKPANGDLFGTEIHTMATNVQYITHVWAGTDWGSNFTRGFSDNEVIGRLVLDRQSSNSVLHFSGAGPKNAMYVDYLVLTNFATNYHSGLDIDPNFTIYFAAANFDPQKLQEIYPNLVWATGFVGPNSTAVVPYANSSITCLMNTNVATSTEISFWDGVRNSDFITTFGNSNLLNNPLNPEDFLPCPGIYAFPCDCIPGTNVSQQLLYSNLTTLPPATNVVLEMDLLTIAYDGQGSITPTLSQSQLALGSNYTLTAKPAKGWAFESWNISFAGQVSNAYSPVLNFVFTNSTSITANFIPNPFPKAAGSYYGLFFETNGIDPTSSGAVSLTMTRTGAFSGRLLMEGNAYNFSSQFGGAGGAQFLARDGARTLSVGLQLDLTNQIGQITGEVTGDSFANSTLMADLTPVWTAANPSPLAGHYTMALPWDTGTDTNDIAGDSYGVATVGPGGVLRMTGALADGVTFSAAAPVSQYGQWPFYVYSATGKDTVVGWVTVTNGLTGNNISWSKAASHGKLYPGGFGTLLQMIGSPWHVPGAGSPPLDPPFPTVTLIGGDLPVTDTISVQLANNLKFAATNLNLSINASSGSFSGWFDSPNTQRKITISGVVLTNQSSARGFFQRTDDSGAVIL